MLYKYTYAENHKIENLHKYIEHFFDIMFNTVRKRFEISLLHPEFIPIASNCDTLVKHLRKVFQLYIKLNQREKDLIITAFRDNNLILELCKGQATPQKYSDIQKDISEALADLFEYLFEGLIKTQIFIKNCCSITEHFGDFIDKNNKYAVCPFCGLYRLNSKYDATRDDYDHYLPKWKYPFSSVNFKNLVPVCRECNRVYKLRKDPVCDDGGSKRKAFYPYEVNVRGVSVNVSINGFGKHPIKEANWHIELIGPQGMCEETEAWDDTYSIRTRYSAFIKQNIGQWIEYVVSRFKSENKKYGIDFDSFMEGYIQELSDEPLMDFFFIRKAVFECLMHDDDFKQSLVEWVWAS